MKQETLAKKQGTYEYMTRSRARMLDGTWRMDLAAARGSGDARSTTGRSRRRPAAIDR
jgi:hypothetical protein